jgi:hypothetical protein
MNEIEFNQLVSIKVASKLLGVTAATLRNWDRSGNLRACRTPGARNSPTRRAAYFSTDGFSLDECHFLSSQLLSLGIHSHPIPTKRPGNFEIYIECRSYFDFIDMVSDYVPCKSMSYKVDISKVKPYKRKESPWEKKS